MASQSSSVPLLEFSVVTNTSFLICIVLKSNALVVLAYLHVVSRLRHALPEPGDNISSYMVNKAKRLFCKILSKRIHGTILGLFWTRRCYRGRGKVVYMNYLVGDVSETQKLEALMEYI